MGTAASGRDRATKDIWTPAAAHKGRGLKFTAGRGKKKLRGQLSCWVRLMKHDTGGNAAISATTGCIKHRDYVCQREDDVCRARTEFGCLTPPPCSKDCYAAGERGAGPKPFHWLRISEEAFGP